jgi:sigma-E factor negative regulatory protein RseC
MPGREEFIEDGIVESVKDGIAGVRVISSGGCEECSAKIFCNSNTDNNLLTAKDGFGVEPGDEVRISVPGKNISSASGLLYGIPLLLLITGILLGNYIFQENKELYSALFSLVLIGIYGVMLYFYSVRRDYSSIMPRIIFVKKTKGI